MSDPFEKVKTLCIYVGLDSEALDALAKAAREEGYERVEPFMRDVMLSFFQPYLEHKPVEMAEVDIEIAD